MLKKTFGLLLLVVVAAFGQEAKISVAPAVIASGFNSSEAFVTGRDMKSRHCPADYNVYVRIDGKKPVDKNLYYVSPGTMVNPQPGIAYSIVCIKEIQ